MVSPCDNCFNRHLTSQAVEWCPICEEALCVSCKEHHTASKLLRLHETVPLEANNQLPSFIAQAKTHCSEHELKYELYCYKHQTTCCPACVKESHQNCQEFETIAIVVKGVKTSPAFEDAEQRVKDIDTNLDAIIENRRVNRARLLNQKDEHLAQIKNKREEIDQHLDKIEESLKVDLSTKVNYLVTEFDFLLESLAIRKETICKLQQDIETTKQVASEVQVFMGMKTLEEKIIEEFKYIESLQQEKALNEKNLELQLSDDVDVESFGSFGVVGVISDSSSIAITEPKREQAQFLIAPDFSLTDLRILQKDVISLSESEISTDFSICGCSFIPGGQMVFCDSSSCRIIICDPNGQHINEIILDRCPSGVTFVKNTSIAITYSKKCRVGITDLLSGKELNSFSTSSKCYGIEFHDEKFTIRTSGKFIITNMEGEVLKEISSTKCLGHVALYHDRIFSTNSSKHLVLSLNSSGETVWKFEDAILVKPRDVTVDPKGLVYVTGESSNNVIVISPDGLQSKEILTSDDGLDGPVAICVESTRTGQRLLVCNKTNGKVILCNILLPSNRDQQ